VEFPKAQISDAVTDLNYLDNYSEKNTLESRLTSKFCNMLVIFKKKTTELKDKISGGKVYLVLSIT